MSGSWEQYGVRVISGKDRGVGASVIRAGLVIPSLIYGALMRLRNAKYSLGIGVKRLPRPVISVGNLTTSAEQKVESLVNQGQQKINGAGAMALMGLQRVSYGVNAILSSGAATAPTAPTVPTIDPIGRTDSAVPTGRAGRSARSAATADRSGSSDARAPRRAAADRTARA